jgi:predicted transcriptional regulator
LFVPCEVAVKSAIPALRATLARELVKNHGLTQQETAKILNVTQAAISYYIRKVRGDVLEVETVHEVRIKCKKIADSLVNGSLSKIELSKHICELCITIRTSKIMCHLCERTDPTLDVSSCDICLGHHVKF